MKITPSAIPSAQTPAIANLHAHPVSCSPIPPRKRKVRKRPCHQDRVCTQIETKPQSPERGMGNSPADKHQTAGNDIGSDDTAGDRGKEATDQCVLKKSIL